MSQSPQDSIPDSSARPGPLARRVRLREFQSQLLERMQAVREGAAPDKNQLGVMIGSQRWLISLKEAGEIVQVGAIASVPLTHAWFKGLVTVRGNLVGVIDFSSFQGFAPLSVERESRIVTVASALSAHSGFLVSRVMGLRNAEEMELVEKPADAARWVEQVYIDRDGERWTRLSIERVIQEPRFLQIAQ